MFSGTKMEKFMGYEHSGISRVEMLTKNVLLGSSGTNFKHMRLKKILSLRLVILQKHNEIFQEGLPILPLDKYMSQIIIRTTYILESISFYMLTTRKY